MNSGQTKRFRPRVEESWIYREFRAMREEIEKHKWLESEKVGYDIGFEQAMVDWIVRYGGDWWRWRRRLWERERRKELQNRKSENSK